MRRIYLTALVVPVVGMAVAAATAAAPSGPAGTSTPPTRSVVAALPIKAPPPLHGTEWHLVGVSAQGRTVTAPYGANVTLRLNDGHFVLRTCNLMNGRIGGTEERLELRNEWGTRRTCPAALGEIDDLLHEAFLAPLRVRRDATSLRLTSLASAAHFRAAESAQPPLHAREVARLDDEGGNCRVLVAATERGPRLFVLARTRPGGPWRLLPGGPAAPEAGPVVSRSLHSTSPASAGTCTAGFAPPGTAAVAAGGRVSVHEVQGIASPVYVASLDSAREHRLEAVTGDGRKLGSWRVGNS
ncbi:MAG: META domain-containing protein [Sporichthyaceae bacterium]